MIESDSDAAEKSNIYQDLEKILLSVPLPAKRTPRADRAWKLLKKIAAAAEQAVPKQQQSHKERGGRHQGGVLPTPSVDISVRSKSSNSLTKKQEGAHSGSVYQTLSVASL